MEITYKNEAPTGKTNLKEAIFPIIFYRIAKNLLKRGHGTDLVQLTHLPI